MADNEICQQLITELDKVRREDGSRQSWKIVYNFDRVWHVEVLEVDDRHTFVMGSGFTPDVAAASAIQSIPQAVEDWGWQLAD